MNLVLEMMKKYVSGLFLFKLLIKEYFIVF